MENEKMMTADDAVETNAAAATAVEINDDAKAEERTTEDSQLSMQTIAAAEALSVIDNVINNTLKLMSGKYGGGFYVNYLQDSGQKTGCLQLIIVYPDENYKRLFLAKNCFLPIEIDGDGIGKIESGDSSYTPKLRESMNYGNFRILEKYETPNMPIPSEVIWKQVIRNYEKIPVVTVYHSEDIEGIYWELYRVAHDDAIANFAAVHRENDVRFLVTKDEMERVACENGITLSQLRTELNLLGLLIKDKGSGKNGKCYNSYQLTKKVDGKNERFYALKKMVRVTSVALDVSCSIEYTEAPIKTAEEIELQATKEQLEASKKQNEADKLKISELYLKRIDDTTPEEMQEFLM